MDYGDFDSTVEAFRLIGRIEGIILAVPDDAAKVAAVTRALEEFDARFAAYRASTDDEGGAE